MQKTIDLEFFKPKARTSRINMWFIDKAVNYANEILKYMEKLNCIDYVYDKESDALVEIRLKIDCPLWFSKEYTRINIRIED